MYKYKLLICGFFLSFFWLLSAQEISRSNNLEARYQNAMDSLSLEDCIRIALERNYGLRIARNEEQIAANNATHGNAGQLPLVGLNSSYGGTLYQTERYYPEDSLSKTPTADNRNFNAGLSLEWTIFNGFKLSTNYAQLQAFKAMGELNTRLTLENFIADLMAEYYNVIRQENQLENLKTSLELSKDRLYIVEASYGIGSASGLDYQQAQVDYNADNSAYIAQLEEVEKTYIRLNEMMALDDMETHFVTTDDSITVNTGLQRGELWKNAMANNTSLLIAIQNRSISQMDLKMAQSRNYPYLKFTAGYDYRYSHYHYNAYDAQRQIGPSYTLSAGITLFDGMNRKREQQNARIRLENQDLALEQYKNAMKADMSNLWIAYTNNLKLWEIEQNNEVVARSNFDIAMERYRLRELSGIELREAQLSLLQSEERLLTAQYNIKLCEISLRLLSGILLDDVQD